MALAHVAYVAGAPVTCHSCSCAAAGRCCGPGQDNRCRNFGNSDLRTTTIIIIVGDAHVQSAPPGWVPRNVGSRSAGGSCAGTDVPCTHPSSDLRSNYHNPT